MKRHLFNKGKLIKIARLLIYSIIIFWVAGCSGYTVVNKTHYYPSDKNSRTADFLMQIEVYGEKRKAYTAKTPKKVIVTVWEGPKKLLSREYICTAASLEWDVVWKELDDLQIVFFDFPEGISIYDEKALGLPAKQIFSLRFTYEKQIKGFTEYPVSQNVVKHVKGQGNDTGQISP